MSSAPPEHAAKLEKSNVDALASWFVASAGAILGITGIAKVWSAFGNAKLLGVADPIIGFKFGHLMLAVAVGEIVVALVCFFSRRQALSTVLVAWLSTNLLTYRLGLWWMDWRSPCGCLGNLTGMLHISPQLADNIMKVVLAYLLTGSYAVLLYQWRKARRMARESPCGTATVLHEPTATK